MLSVFVFPKDDIGRNCNAVLAVVYFLTALNQTVNNTVNDYFFRNLCQLLFPPFRLSSQYHGSSSVVHLFAALCSVHDRLSIARFSTRILEWFVFRRIGGLYLRYWEGGGGLEGEELKIYITEDIDMSMI